MKIEALERVMSLGKKYKTMMKYDCGEIGVKDEKEIEVEK